MQIPRIRVLIESKIERFKHAYSNICMEENRNIDHLQDFQETVYQLKSSLDDMELAVQDKIKEMI